MPFQGQLGLTQELFNKSVSKMAKLLSSFFLRSLLFLGYVFSNAL